MCVLRGGAGAQVVWPWVAQKMSSATHRARENLRVLSPTLAAAPGKASTYSAVVHGYIAPLGQRDPDGLYRSPFRRAEGSPNLAQPLSPSSAAPAAYTSPIRRGQQPIGEPLNGGKSPTNKAPRAVFRSGKPTTAHVYAHEGKHGSIPRPIAYSSKIRHAEIIEPRMHFAEGDYVSPIRRYAAADEQQARTVRPEGSNDGLQGRGGALSPEAAGGGRRPS